MTRRLLLAAWAGACAPPGDALHGSLAEVVDLSFAATRARTYPGELAIEYVAASGQVALRLAVPADAPLAPAAWDLAGSTLSVAEDSGVVLPPVARGTLVVEAADAGWIDGRFEAVLTHGLAVTGAFAAPVEAIDVP